MDEDFSFKVEYAKSGRSACKKCKQNIGKDVLRMAILVQSPVFDGKMPLWHHVPCFFQKKNKLTNSSEIANFANLRWEDQEKITKLISGGPASSNGPTSKSSKSSMESDFKVDNAKSNRSTCRGCNEKIAKGTVRISKKDDDPAKQRYGGAELWHHVDCFVKRKEELAFTDSAAELNGFDDLSEEDKTMLLQKVGSKGIKRKAEEDSPSVPKEKKMVRTENKILKEQSKLLFDMRDKLAANFSKKEMIELLEINEQHIPTGESRLLDHLSECLVFGGLSKCPECKNTAPRFLDNTYLCKGNLTEWTKCQYQSKYPQRKIFIVPDDYKEEHSFLAKYKPVVKERKFAEADVPQKLKKNLPLTNYKVVLIGKLDSLPKITKELTALGATIGQKVDDSIDLCISNLKEVAGTSSKMKKIKEKEIHVVSVDFIDAVSKGSPVAHSIKEFRISPWGGDPMLKFGIKQENKLKSEAKEAKSSFKSVPQKLKLTAHGSAAVDPDSGMDTTCSVYEKKNNVYNSVLSHVDMAKGTNSFYKLQVLETLKHPKKYYVFRAWGRVGTTIGGNKLQNFDNCEDAVNEFKKLFEEKSLNSWKDRKKFVKKPGGMFPLDLDYGDNAKLQKQLKPGGNSKLPKTVQELICLLFDIEAMKKAMVEFEIDMEKMPLGKLSKKQIQMAYKVLGEAQQIILTGCNNAKVTDVTNRFFTLIPHDFGMKKPTRLDDEEIIKSKVEMLDSLMEIELAYKLLTGEHSDLKDPVDEHYEKLNTDIEILEKSTDEYGIVQKYLKNTHAATHDRYSLELKEVFKINRHGEKERYQKYSSLHNKKLLWHGSRLTNFVGILSQGLRIAPPEAPATGYMFGKGVYFADMVSKSANYCCTSKMNSTGVLLLCEVALGNMYERTHSDYIQKLPDQKHSTYGMGQTIPDPNEKTFLDNVEVPYGKPSPRTGGNNYMSLLYNEYIVYDVSQINIKYLLKVNFKYKY